MIVAHSNLRSGMSFVQGRPWAAGYLSSSLFVRICYVRRLELIVSFWKIKLLVGMQKNPLYMLYLPPVYSPSPVSEPSETMGPAGALVGSLVLLIVDS